MKMTADKTEHIIVYYETMTELYTDAAAIGINVAHVAEWMLEHWWVLWVEANPTEVITIGDIPIPPAPISPFTTV